MGMVRKMIFSSGGCARKRAGKLWAKRVRLSTLLSSFMYICHTSDRFEILPVRGAVEEAGALVAHKPGHR